MEVAYISGPYRAESTWGVWMNVQRASEAALKYWKNGYAVICPHRNTAFFDGTCPDETWLAGDLELLRRCDIIVFIQGWSESIGSKAENLLAKKLRKKIIYET